MSRQENTIEKLFVSKVRLKALKFFTLNFNRSIHLRAAVREFDEEINAVRRELVRLEEVKLLDTETKGNRKYFKFNMDHPYAGELISMFNQSYGLGGELIRNKRKLGDIDFAFLTPCFTKGFYFGDQIVDLVIIGVVDMTVLNEIIGKHEHKSGREVHYTVFKPSEYAIRKRRRDQFLFDIMLQDLVMLIGKYEEMIR